MLMTSGAIIDILTRFGIEYLESNRYNPASLGKHDVTRTFYFRRNRQEFSNLSSRYADALDRSTDLPGLSVRFLGKVPGYGLFTLESISPGDLIGEYTGIVRRARPGRAIPGGGYTSDYAWGFPGVRPFGRELEIDAREAGGLLRFANHVSGTDPGPSAEPEHFPSGGQWHVVFIARRFIEAGGEITVDYGDAYWSGGERELLP